MPWSAVTREALRLECEETLYIVMRAYKAATGEEIPADAFTGYPGAGRRMGLRLRRPDHWDCRPGQGAARTGPPRAGRRRVELRADAPPPRACHGLLAAADGEGDRPPVPPVGPGWIVAHQSSPLGHRPGRRPVARPGARSAPGAHGRGTRSDRRREGGGAGAELRPSRQPWPPAERPHRAAVPARDPQGGVAAPSVRGPGPRGARETAPLIARRGAGRGERAPLTSRCLASAPGGTRTPSLLIRRSVHHVPPVPVSPLPQVTIHRVRPVRQPASRAV